MSKLWKVIVVSCIAIPVMTCMFNFSLQAEPIKKKIYPCNKVTKKLLIDGKLDDWWQYKPQALPLVFNNNISIGDRRGPKDIDVICYLLWDKDNFYLAAEVTDDKHVTKFGSALWQADGFQLAFDPKNDSIDEPRYGPEDIEFGFTGTDNGQSYAYMEKHEDGSFLGKFKAEDIDIRYKRNKENTGGIFEVAIPWRILKNIKAENNTLFGFNVLYNENDGKIRRGWISWTPGIGSIKNAWFFNKVKLVTNHQLADHQVFITVNKPYFIRGENAITYCYIPYYGTKTAKANVNFAVVNNNKEIYSKQKELSLKPGMNLVEFAYKIADNLDSQCKQLPISVKVDLPSTSKQLVLRSSFILNSVEVLKKQATDIAKKNDKLRVLIENAKAKGVDTRYPDVTRATVDLFLKHRLHDLNSPKLLKRFKPLNSIKKQFDYLDKAIAKAENEAKMLVKNPDSAKTLPVVDNMTLSVKNGQFCDANGNPVMLLGPSVWDDGWKDIKLYKDMGFNFIDAISQLNWVIAGPGQYVDKIKHWNMTPGWHLGQKKKHFKAAQKYNMAVHYLCVQDRVPQAWYDAYPDLKANNGFIQASYYSDGLKKMVDQYWGRVVPMFRDEPALLTWTIVNEWFNFEGIKQVHPKMIIRFHDHLRKKYLNISALNKQWGTSYKSFDKIDFLKFNPIATPGPYYDWESFRQEEGLNLLKMFINIVKRYDAKTPIQAKIISYGDFGQFFGGRTGAERENVNDAFEITGVDVAQAENFNLLKSLHPDRPVMDSEVHTPVLLTPEADVVRLWHTFLNGQSGRLFFGVANSYSATFLGAGAYLHIPWTFEQTGRTSLDIRRLASEIVQFQNTIAKAEVGILYSPTSRILAEKHLPAAAKMFGVVSKLDAPIRFISERQINKDGQLKALKLLIVTDAKSVLPETFNNILEFAKSGGMVVASGKSLTRSPYNKPYPVNTLAAAGVKSIDGAGRKTFDAIFDAAGVDRKVRIVRVDGQSKKDIETRIIKTKDGFLAYLINYGPLQKLKFNFKCENIKIKDLISEHELETEFSIKPSSVLFLRVKCKGELQFKNTAKKSLRKLPVFSPKNDDKKLTKQEEAELSAFRKKLSLTDHFKCKGTPDVYAVNGTAKHRNKVGMYFWWQRGKIKKGRYLCVVRAKVDNPAKHNTIGLILAVDQTSKQKEVIRSNRLTNTKYKEIKIPFEYDGTYSLRLNDWSSAGMWVDYVYIVPDTRKISATILALRKKLKTVRHLKCTGTPDKLAVNGSARHNKKIFGNFWWRLGKIKKGKYLCVVRVKVDNPKKWNGLALNVIDAVTKKRKYTIKSKRLTNTEYKEIKIPFEYDGTFPLELNDWSAANMWVDYVYIVPDGNK